MTNILVSFCTQKPRPSLPPRSKRACQRRTCTSICTKTAIQYFATENIPSTHRVLRYILIMSHASNLFLACLMSSGRKKRKKKNNCQTYWFKQGKACLFHCFQSPQCCVLLGCFHTNWLPWALGFISSQINNNKKVCTAVTFVKKNLSHYFQKIFHSKKKKPDTDRNWKLKY